MSLACRRYGNVVVDTTGEPILAASLSGPGPADACVQYGQSGAVEVLCTARTAGDYVLSVFDAATGDMLFGSPFKVRLDVTSFCTGISHSLAGDLRRGGPSSQPLLARTLHCLCFKLSCALCALRTMLDAAMC
jgi:hypothetical protein